MHACNAKPVFSLDLQIIELASATHCGPCLDAVDFAL